MSSPANPSASIVIPAHNEESVIGRCLESLIAEGAGDLEVVVVTNGCSDATAEVARGYADRLPELQVLEIAQASKIAALNAGDSVVSAFPRVYLDADIELAAGALRALVEVLGDDVDAVAAPVARFDTSGAGVVPRAFFEVFTRLPYVRRGLVGLGVYALSDRGRSRFADFPAVIADDLFVQQLFAERDRLTTAGTFVVRVPRGAKELVRVRARGADGARELARLSLSPHRLDDERGSTVASLGVLAATRPWMLAQIAVYVGVTIAARRLAARQSGVWQRDESTRGTANRVAAARPVAYVMGAHPRLSQTFIEREVLGLRAMGVDVRTFSVRPPGDGEVRGEVAEAEARGTPVLTNSWTSVLRRAGGVALRHPGAAARLLTIALRTGQRTPRAALWQVFYAVEALVLFSYLHRPAIRHIHVHIANNAADVARLTVALGRLVDGPDAGWRWSLTMHGPTEFEAVEKFDLAAKVISADAVACISHFTRSQLMRLVPAEEWVKLHIVRMSVDIDRYPLQQRDDRTEGPLRVLFVGRLVAEKGVMVLLDATADAVARGLDVELRVVGGGAMAEAVTRAVHSLGLQDVVTLLGPLVQDDVVAEFARADVFCLPSFQEGLPVVLMEALASGLPVVTTAVNGIPELVVDRKDGRLLTPGRSDLVADALIELASDPDARTRMGLEGRRRVEAEFTSEVTARAQAAFLAGVPSVR